MRICQFSDSFLPVVDGVGRVVASYAQSLGQLGHTVTVCAPKTDMGDISAFPYEVLAYSAVQMPGKMPYHVGFPSMDVHFVREVHSREFDILHVHSPFMSGWSGQQLARRRQLPLVGSFHSKYYDDFAQTLKSEFFAREGVKKIVEFYEQCDEVWAVSESTAETLQSYGYQGKVISMPNGTDIRALDPAVLPELRARYGLREGEPLLLFVGQMNWKKNIALILQAARLLRDRGMSFRLVLAGQGPHTTEIKHQCEQLGIQDRTLFTGHLQSTRELDGLYTLASLFVFPSMYDNAPLVLREAAAMGTPAVLVAGSSSAEGIQDGINGLTCEENAQSLADAIARGLKDPSALREIGLHARETIPVAWSKLMKQVVARYERLIHERQ